MRENEKGQALLLILLTMAAIVTAVSSIVARSITDVTITTKEVESQRAFSAAEAGIEKTLLTGTGATDVAVGSPGALSSYSALVTDFGRGSAGFVYPTGLVSGDLASIWFVSHATDDSLSCSGASNPCLHGDNLSMEVCWGKPGSTDATALEITVFYANNPGDYSSMRVARAAIDPDSSRASQNKFSFPDLGTCTNLEGEDFKYHKTLSFTGAPPSGLNIPAAVVRSGGGGLQFARLRLLYNTTAQPVGVRIVGGGVLPSQGRLVNSVGRSGDTSRKVQVYSLFSDLPPVFDSAIFTPGGLAQ